MLRVSVVLLVDKREPADRDVERVPEVVADDAGKVLQTVTLASEFLLTAFTLLLRS